MTGEPRALIADDEPLLRDQLRLRLAELWPGLAVVAEAGNGEEAVAAFEAHRPDIAFLDIHMPGTTGLAAARAIGTRARIVFVTAFDQHAVEAFERGAVDYLLKPLSPERLALTVERLKAALAAGAPPPADPGPLLDELARRLSGGTRAYLRWVRASVGAHVRLIPVDEVLFFDAGDKYTRVVTREGEAWIRKPIRELVEELDPARFWQVHRATIVNAAAVAGLVRDSRDSGELLLRDWPERLTVSRTYLHLFRQM